MRVGLALRRRDFDGELTAAERAPARRAAVIDVSPNSRDQNARLETEPKRSVSRPNSRSPGQSLTPLVSCLPPGL